MPDPRAGNQVALNSAYISTTHISAVRRDLLVLSDYVTACSGSNITTTPSNASTIVKLQVPDNWDGPFGQGLNTGTTVIAFIAALTLGVGGISVLCVM